MALVSILFSMGWSSSIFSAFHHGLDPLAAEQAHQIVLQREEEPAGAWVALTAGAAAQLVVDPAGLVALGAQDEQAASLADLLGLRLDLLFVFCCTAPG